MASTPRPRGPGGQSEWRVTKLRDGALVGAQQVLEEKQEQLLVPKVIETAQGLQLAPAAEEFIRLEGHQWRTHWEQGRGSVYQIEHFGLRGEGVLVPDFVCLEKPLEGPSLWWGTEQREMSYLAKGLAQQAKRVEHAAKMCVADVIHHIRSSDSYTLLLPVARLSFKRLASPQSFSRASARRFPFYVDSVQTGARLELSVVPALKTRSGDPDLLDAEQLAEELGAELVPLSGRRGKLCVRRMGGPPLQLAALGAPLEELCQYINTNWVDALFAQPTTWARLFVHVRTSQSLEASLGHVPGCGVFTRQLHEPLCRACGEGTAVGSEQIEETLIPLCKSCAAFVKGSEGFFSKEKLAQYTSRPPQELQGAFDVQLDDTLKVLSSNITPSWRGIVPEDCAVLAAGGLLSLKPPRRGWPEDLEKQVHRQLGMVIGCEDEFLRITATSTEAETPNRMVAFVLIHPAVLQAGKEDPKEFIDPQMPLQWFRRLESELARMAKNQVLRVRWAKTEEDVAVPLLLISDEERVLLPCSLFLLKNDHPPVVTPTPTPATARRASSIPGDLGLALDQLRERLHSKEGGPDERRRSIEVQRRRSHQARRATVAELASGGLRLEELRRHSEAKRKAGGVHRASLALSPVAEPEGPEWPEEPAQTSSSSSSSASGSNEAEEAQTEARAGRAGRVSSAAEPVKKASWIQEVESKMQIEEPCQPAPPHTTSVAESPVQRAVLGFRPTTEQMAKRLCDLVLRGAVKAVENLLLRGQSALDLSVKSCNYHMTFALLKHLPPELPENLVELLNGHNPVTGHSLLYAAVRFSNRHTQQVVRELVLRRADLNAPGSSPSPQSECALACCVRRADVALVEQLLAQQAAVDAWGDDGQTVLQIAVARGSEDILSSLLYGPVPCDPNLRDRYGRTALMMALQKDRRPPYSLVYQLLIASAEVETSDLEGRQPLSYAVGLGDSEPLRALLNRQADPNAVARPRADPKGRLLHAAAEARDEVLIRCLIEARADVTLEGKHGRSLLHLAVGLELSEDTLALILAHRGDPNASCGLRAGGETALRLAVQAPSGKGAELLLHARADVNGCNLAGCSALHAACVSGNSWTAQTLISFGADVASLEKRWRSTLAAGTAVPAAQVSSTKQPSIQTTIHPMHLASTWRRARWRPQQGRPRFFHTEEVKDFDPLFPFNLPPIQKLRKTR
ncbi:Putative ankyrin repeat protein RF_0381 [Durusdinium trenchii]|uniref:Ankyrin repeat protein RF_0381 n=1 Tax=Durusdinium trenchii TaxID=1381693 RepID=A0ABP0QPL2_9DINO